ncbi:MAG TPA: DUF692 domain-containing protein [Terriglobales bacterium]|nr:DUF692 domain-containing protein [Terriglobales bacterium]
MTRSESLPHLGFGVGLRVEHYSDVLEQQPAVDWFEIISENFLVPGGRALYVLDQVRQRYPVAMHGVSLSIGSVDPIDRDYLHQLRRLAERIEPAWISDHLCFTGVGGHNAHDLLPLPYTEEAIAHVAERVARVQDVLGRRLLLENVSTYLEYSHSVMPEWQFLTAVAERADCLLLLDVNNVFVSAFNHGFSAEEYLDAIPPRRVAQFHLAGHSDKGTFLHDTHDHPVPPGVWQLYRHALQRIGSVATLIEWDDQIPAFARLQQEAETARAIAQAAAAPPLDAVEAAL